MPWYYAFIATTKDQARQTIPELVASLLKQVIQDQSQISDKIKSFYKHHKIQGSHPNCEELKKAFQSEIGTSTVFVVVDALDECPECDQELLISELQSLASTLHLMVTSRPLPLIEQLFSECDSPGNPGKLMMTCRNISEVEFCANVG